MILCEFTPDGGALQRISDEDIALDYQWLSYLKSISSIKFQLPQVYGGYAGPSFSDIVLWPEAFENDWPPPTTATVKIVETDTTFAGGKVVFDGSGTVGEIDRTGVGLILKKPELDIKIAASTAYNDTLVNVVTTLATTCGLTVVSTRARAVSPAVLHTTAAEILAIDLLSSMCAWFSHGYEIKGTVLYLVDMKDTTQTPIELTEFDVQPCSYRKADPVLLVKCGDYSVDGASDNGDEVDVGDGYHTTEANILGALGDIKTLLELDIATIRFKTDQVKPGILDRITLTDESLLRLITFTGIITSIIYNYDTLSVEAEVLGSMSA